MAGSRVTPDRCAYQPAIASRSSVEPEVRRVAMIRGIRGGLLQDADDSLGRRKVRVADSQRDDVDARLLFRLHLAIDLSEEVGRDLSKALGTAVHGLAHADSLT